MNEQIQDIKDTLEALEGELHAETLDKYVIDMLKNSLIKKIEFIDL